MTASLRTLRSAARASLAFLLGWTVLAAPSLADPLAIVVDGVHEDWGGSDPAWVDPTGDGAPGGIDFSTLYAADDDRFLFVRIDLGRETLLNEGNGLVLYLDTDANSQTGFAVGGIGAELEWRFGQRNGYFRYGGQATPVEHPEIRFRAMPTVTSREYELAIGRDTRPDGSHPLFLGPVTRILFVDSGGDRLPNGGQFLEYAFDEGTLPADESLAIGREAPGDVRVVNWNVLQDGPWQAQKGPKFDRILSAIAPDVLNFQEIYDHTPQETAALVESWLPSGAGEAWYAAGNQDCKTISRFPVLATWALDGNLGVLLDASARLGHDLLIVNAHLPCCSNNTQRQAEIDRILSFLKDARTPGGAVDVPEGTPYYITGDLNLVTLARHLNSLVTGDIQNEGTYGADFDPDWDGSDLTDLLTRQTSKRMVYTWRSETSNYWPGHLDFVIYTDSVLDARNHFVLYTQEMPADSLARYGLLSTDSSASDHLPVCADFRTVGPTDTTDQTSRRAGVHVGPNPWRGRVAVTVDEAGVEAVRVRVIDAQGRLAGYPAGEDWMPAPGGRARMEWSLDDGVGGARPLPAGVYVLEVEMRTPTGVRTERVKTVRFP